MNEYEKRELGWDEEVEDSGGSFPLVSAGDYDFTVRSFERGRYEGGSKIPACNQAQLKLDVTNGTESTTVSTNLLLFSTLQWKLAQFFKSIGSPEVDGRVKMNWNMVFGATGRCKVGIRKYKDKNGVERESNEILEFYPADQAAQSESPTQSKWKPGAF